VKKNCALSGARTVCPNMFPSAPFFFFKDKEMKASHYVTKDYTVSARIPKFKSREGTSISASLVNYPKTD